MANDSNGIYKYTESEAVPSTFSAFLNKLAASVSTRIGQIQDTLTTNIADTGWSNLVLGSGATAPDSTLRPMIRRKNGIVYIMGRMTQSGAVGFTIPAGYRPAQNLRTMGQAGSTGSAVVVLVIPTDGAAYTSADATINLAHSWPVG
ncbi:hypothetical protein D6T64_05610 [Cryobacterium melibiosiphilum]|uniref:Uncharacterized protein n=1 Tax=Cryobacterium melibiosiphilum TaxID=995039 RepID=A0A3A5MLE5_9MICO|nr:hypothetical protein [Cryobacterium melibiosiphilum]RJT89811.1 hypothetical protein D6T64_05610 [Cryobacterium melibiosiphilum]